ncbi:MarR family transcriptional regulator [Nonomuraea zeae]|uniref:MarR family transcriptional regulator n=1 Tax=Nonomuraea zeae TaxID=1642303 RepID=A0A5S4GLZ2_9ACTN|nr:MarR family transcriptional regulator [Nonomuraea zeae]
MALSSLVTTWGRRWTSPPLPERVSPRCNTRKSVRHTFRHEVSSSRVCTSLRGRRATFLTHHARVLIEIARDPGVRMRDIAASIGITERTAQNIVRDLYEAGYLTRERIGRRNRYSLNLDRQWSAFFVGGFRWVPCATQAAPSPSSTPTTPASRSCGSPAWPRSCRCRTACRKRWPPRPNPLRCWITSSAGTIGSAGQAGRTEQCSPRRARRPLAFCLPQR